MAKRLLKENIIITIANIGHTRYNDGEMPAFIENNRQLFPDCGENCGTDKCLQKENIENDF